MDANLALRRALRAARAVARGRTSPARSRAMAAHLLALHALLRRGGRLPRAWALAAPRPPPTCRFCHSDELGWGGHVHLGAPVCDDCWDERAGGEVGNA